MLSQLESLLGELRAFASLVERAPGRFDLGRRHFLHFHATADGIVADVFLSSGRIRVPVTTKLEQAELLAVVAESLSSAERRAGASRAKRGRRRGSHGSA